MAITTRAGKGSPLTNTELDTNFTELMQEYSGEVYQTTSVALTVADIRKVVRVDAASLTITLPALSTIDQFDGFDFVAYFPFTLAVNGTDTIRTPNDAAAANASVAIDADQTFTVVKIGTAWAITRAGKLSKGSDTLYWSS